MAFEQKVALVTGGASGIGEALCRVLAERGARVTVVDLDLEGAQAVARDVGGQAVALDVTDGGAFERVVEQVVAREGRIDLLFNNAGVGLAGLVQDLSAADWQRVIDVNLGGVVNGVRAVYPRMLAQRSGHIVNTASGAALAPRPGMVPYAATKAAVVALGMSLRAEAASHGVRVSSLCPGYVATRILSEAPKVNLDADGLAGAIPLKPITARTCAERCLAGVERNRPLIFDSLYTRLDWWVSRLSPSLGLWLAGYRARTFARHRLTS